jgi:hypothetical protein
LFKPGQVADHVTAANPSGLQGLSRQHLTEKHVNGP